MATGPTSIDLVKMVDPTQNIVYNNTMSFPTTVSITAHVDMQDSLEGFVVHKALPGARMRLADQTQEHRFTKPGEQHRFTLTVDLQAGEHHAELEFIDDKGPQGAIEITALHIQGTPVGLEIYQCEYTQWETKQTERSHLYMGRPGVWRIALRVPRGGVGFG